MYSNPPVGQPPVQPPFQQAGGNSSGHVKPDVDPSSTAANGVGELAAVSLTSKIPDFWTDQPKLWYAQLEAVLEPQRLGEVQKFNIVVTKLGKTTVEAASDIIFAPPAAGRYEVLKERLLSVFQESEQKRQHRLFHEMELGDQRPSQLMRRMKSLADEKFPDSTIRMLWIGHMPPAVKAVLAGSEITDLQKLAELADKIVEATGIGATVSEVATVPAHSSDDRWLAEIAKISTRLKNLEHGQSAGRSGAREGSQNQPQRRERQSRRRNDPDWVCFYHFRYGEKATRCTKPCNWKAGN